MFFFLKIQISIKTQSIHYYLPSLEQYTQIKTLFHLSLDDSNSVRVTRTSSPTLTVTIESPLEMIPNSTASETAHLNLFDIFLPVFNTWFIVDEWVDTSVQVGEFSSSFVSGNHQNWNIWFVFRNQSSRKTTGGQDNNSFSILFVSSRNSGNSTSFSGSSWF